MIIKLLHIFISVGALVSLLVFILRDIIHVYVLYKMPPAPTALGTYFRQRNLPYAIMGAMLFYLLLDGGLYAVFSAIAYFGVILVGERILLGNLLSSNERKEDKS